MTDAPADPTPTHKPGLPAGLENLETEIDLNHHFPGEEGDLNTLFPDIEMKQFLKKVSRNKKDLERMRTGFTATFSEADETEKSESSAESSCADSSADSGE
jgi:hypothetical protein